MSHVIELDARHRASLGALASYDRYLAKVETDGTIVLTPAVVLSAAEAALLERPDIIQGIESNRAAGLPGRRQRPSRKRP